MDRIVQSGFQTIGQASTHLHRTPRLSKAPAPRRRRPAWASFSRPKYPPASFGAPIGAPRSRLCARPEPHLPAVPAPWLLHSQSSGYRGCALLVPALHEPPSLTVLAPGTRQSTPHTLSSSQRRPPSNALPPTDAARLPRAPRRSKAPCPPASPWSPRPTSRSG